MLKFGSPHWKVLLLQRKQFVPPLKNAQELRPYQQDGINWLAFLKDCGLHGVLADDMGLGKTLQATAILAGVSQKPANHKLAFYLDPQEKSSKLQSSETKLIPQ